MKLIHDTQLNKFQEQQKVNAKLISDLIAEYTFFENWAQVDVRLYESGFAASNFQHLWIVNSNNSIVSSLDPHYTGKKISALPMVESIIKSHPNEEQGFTSKVIHQQRLSESEAQQAFNNNSDTEMLLTLASIYHLNQQLGVLVVSNSLTPLKSSLISSLTDLSLWIFLVILLFLPIITFLSKRIVLPVSELTERLNDLKIGAQRSMESVNFGDLCTPIKEINHLVDGVNSLKIRLQDNWISLNESMNTFQKAKQASLGELSSGLAHEINNPLQIITGFRSQLERILQQNSNQLDNLEMVQDLLNEIEVQTTRMALIVKNFSEYARGNKELKESVDLKEISRRSAALIHQTLRENYIVLQVVEHSDAMTTEGNASLLQQALINLLLNAKDALLKNPRNRRKIIVQCHRKRDGLHWVVSDNGCGIDKEHINRIFDPFFTTKNKGTGSGLGLSIVYTIISEHRGKITCSSSSENGTAFTIILPAQPAKELDKEAV